jgi:hypothetical protein
MADIYLQNFWTYNWLITPAAPETLETPLDQKWLLVMSGVVSGDQDPALGDWAVLKGISNSAWLPVTVAFLPGLLYSLDNGGEGGPLYYAIDKYSFPPPPYPGWRPAFSVEQAVSFVGLNGTFDANQSINAGYAVKEWRPSQYITKHSAYSGGAEIYNIFTGIDVDIGVRDNDAWILKLGFNITLLGKIVFVDSGGVVPQ